MGFGNKQPAARISGDRLAAVTGGTATAAAAVAGGAAIGGAAARRRVSVEPDLSKIRKNRIEETAEERKKRLAAKTVNFGATIIARIVIIGAAGLYGYSIYEGSGAIPRGVAIGIFAMLGDLGRVVLKALEPGSK